MFSRLRQPLPPCVAAISTLQRALFVGLLVPSHHLRPPTGGVRCITSRVLAFYRTPFSHVKTRPLSSFSLLFHPHRHTALCRAAFLVVGCLAASPSCLAAGRSAAVAAAAGRGNSSPVISQPVTPRFASPSNGQFTDSDVSQLNFQSQLNRLSNASAQSYDIVPPAQPTPIPNSSLPGYQVVRLGRAHNNRLLLTGTVAGTKGLLMLDTGANNTALGDATYHSLLLNASYTLPDDVPRTVSLNGTRTPLAEAPDFYVGQSNLGAVPVSLIPRRYLSDPGPAGSQGRTFDGLLGENILRHYHAMIDCARLVLYLDIDPARKLNLASSFARHGWTRVPMSDSGKDFTVPCTLNGHAYRLIVDTGAPFTNLDRNLLTAAGVGSRDLPIRTGLIGTEAVPVGLVDLDQLQIGGYAATGVHMIATTQSLVAFSRRDDPSAAPIVGLLGGDLLAKNGAIIDIGNKALYLKRADTPAPKSKPAGRHRTG